MTNRTQLEQQYNYLCKQTNTNPKKRSTLFKDVYLLMEINQILTKNNCIPYSVDEIEDMLND
jgi:hypothetical protein